ncbi:MAG TPA: NAD-binding protein [Pyrinomonadaceae bacterium]|nr:NAD-binding protein [Pyrinomonadaceae bacterium]
MSLTDAARSRILRRPTFRFRYALLAMAAALAVGTTGFHLVEGWTWEDSLYMSVLTVTTVGYGEVQPMHPAGRAFAIAFMLVGVSIVAYSLSAAVRSVVESEMVATFGERRLTKKMSKLRNHFIICGAGRVGAHLIRDIERAGDLFVVIENDPAKVSPMSDRGVIVLVRDATLEDALIEAGVERARGLAACLPKDADNVYVVLTARGLNPDLHIVARAAEEQAHAKLIRAGANRVVAPTIIGGRRMAVALMKPAVDDFFDSLATEDLDVSAEQVEIEAGSSLVGRKLRFTPIRSELDIVIVSMRHKDGSTLFNPSGDAIIEAGDVLIAIGRADSLAQLNAQAKGGVKSGV